MLTAMLDEKTHETWTLWARSRGVSATALVEAIGRQLEQQDGPEAKLPPWLRRAIRDARDIDHDRRRR